MKVSLKSEPSPEFSEFNSIPSTLYFNGKYQISDAHYLLVFHGLEGKKINCYNKNGHIVWSEKIEVNAIEVKIEGNAILCTFL